MKCILLMAGVFVLATSVNYQTLIINNFLVRQMPDLSKIQWQVGDFQERRVKKAGLGLARLSSWVDRQEGDGIWLLNDLKVVLRPKKHIEILISKSTGEILRYIVDGEEKDPPDVTKLDECEEVSQVTAIIQVPAGRFKTDRSVMRCDDDSFALWTAHSGVNMGGFVRLALLTEEEDPQKPDYVAEITKYGRR